MRRSDERRQWEHTDEEEALHGMRQTGLVQMPPSLRSMIAALEKVRDAMDAKLSVAEAKIAIAQSLMSRLFIIRGHDRDCCCTVCEDAGNFIGVRGTASASAGVGSAEGAGSEAAGKAQENQALQRGEGKQ